MDAIGHLHGCNRAPPGMQSGTTRDAIGHLQGSNQTPPGKQSDTSREATRHLQGSNQAPPGMQSGTSREATRHLQGSNQAPPGMQSGTSREAIRHLQGSNQAPPGIFLYYFALEKLPYVHRNPPQNCKVVISELAGTQYRRLQKWLMVAGHSTCAANPTCNQLCNVLLRLL